jgi:maleate isomerase
MPDVLAWRKKFGVLAPSTNTVVEPDFYQMAVPGVTAHMGRIWYREPKHDMGDRDFTAKRRQEMDGEMTEAAITRVLTSEPDYIVMACSAPTFIGGLDGNKKWKDRMIGYTEGLRVANGAEACQLALNSFNVKRIAVLTPYWAHTSDHVVRFYQEAGFEVVSHKDLQCHTPVAIAKVTPEECREALLEIDSDRVDAIVQCGTNLSMVRVAAEAEGWLGKPVIAINAATWWMALRENNIQDKLYGFGRLLTEF